MTQDPAPSALTQPEPSWVARAVGEAGVHTLGTPRRWFAAIGSTNRHALGWAAAGAPHGALVLADAQTAGRGRYGRTWQTPPSCALAASLVLRHRRAGSVAGRVGLAAALAVAHACEAAAPVDARLKWPNDVRVGGGKVAGILLERSGASDALVLGIGVNVGAESARGVAGAVSLETAAQAPVDRAGVLGALLSELERLLVWIDEADAAHLRACYEARLDGLGEPVALWAGADQTPHRGRLAGVSPDGALRLATHGGLRTFYAGEVTLRAPHP